ncbi:hypothetical protein [Nocardioides mesophilus]|uniref:Uncharacterized protein n=1 Tax=Nocardioides mesophilus TaxID=433659 RepID=A0A7G9RDV5_9ACTN|nr:hypothetical protein [Nocardioides mesophilus]QNN53780.1 hypothetical protein H9L09_05060 [Nocardioides mesophilus]
MTSVVLRVRLVGGDSMDVVYEHAGTEPDGDVVDHVVTTLSGDSGALRCRHGDRLLVIYGRGVAALEVGPRGAIL